MVGTQKIPLPGGRTLNVHRYELPGGWEVLAGRSDADNDLLSLAYAAANDFWFHVRGTPGSHVILRVAPGGEPDTAALKQAAGVAAWHSRMQKGGTVAVTCTRARYVTKPRGARPGTVAVRREKIFKVRPELP